MNDTPDNGVHGTITVPARFNGPPASANGGYVSALLAQRAGAAVGGPAVRVRLRRPPPLGTPMAVRRGPDGAVHAEHAGVLIAEAALAPDPEPLLAPVSPAVAERAQQGFRGHTGHPFPTCFSCGPHRASGDGLRLFAGPVPDQPDPHTVACAWTPAPAHAGFETVWAALDCPGGWSSDITGRPMVLGQLTALVRALPRTGAAHVVVGHLLDARGRKVLTASALFDDQGAELARASAVWITVDAG